MDSFEELLDRAEGLRMFFDGSMHAEEHAAAAISFLEKLNHDLAALLVKDERLDQAADKRFNTLLSGLTHMPALVRAWADMWDTDKTVAHSASAKTARTAVLRETKPDHMVRLLAFSCRCGNCRPRESVN